jgi:hypothetical protein
MEISSNANPAAGNTVLSVNTVPPAAKPLAEERHACQGS